MRLIINITIRPDVTPSEGSGTTSSKSVGKYYY